MSRIEAAQSKFTEIYDKDLWNLKGNGWSVGAVQRARWERFTALIQEFMELNSVTSVVEFGCGFWGYARLIDWSGVRYDGYDVVPRLVERNRRRHGKENIHFHLLEPGLALPKADLLISKDVLQHLPTEDVHYYLAAFKKLYKHMLIMNDIVPNDNMNGDIPVGGCRSLRFDLPPYNEKLTVVQRWEGSDFFVPWVKHLCLLQGDPDPEISSIALL